MFTHKHYVMRLPVKDRQQFHVGTVLVKLKLFEKQSPTNEDTDSRTII